MSLVRSDNVYEDDEEIPDLVWGAGIDIRCQCGTRGAEKRFGACARGCDHAGQDEFEEGRVFE